MFQYFQVIHRKVIQGLFYDGNMESIEMQDVGHADESSHRTKLVKVWLALGAYHHCWLFLCPGRTPSQWVTSNKLSTFMLVQSCIFCLPIHRYSDTFVTRWSSLGALKPLRILCMLHLRTTERGTRVSAVPSPLAQPVTALGGFFPWLWGNRRHAALASYLNKVYVSKKTWWLVFSG